MTSLNFSIREQWKELMLYVEGDREHAFQCEWGGSPRTLHLPSAAAWERETPAWMHGRREEIVARMREACSANYEIIEKN